jgi:hypothetical protein
MRGKRLFCMRGIFILMLPGHGIREKGNVCHWTIPEFQKAGKGEETRCITKESYALWNILT